MNLLHHNLYKPATCFGHILWPFQGGVFSKNIFQRQLNWCKNIKDYQIKVQIPRIYFIFVYWFGWLYNTPFVKTPLWIRLMKVTETYTKFTTIIILKKSYISIHTCLFYSHSATSVPGNEILKTKICCTVFSWIIYGNNFCCFPPHFISFKG